MYNIYPTVRFTVYIQQRPYPFCLRVCACLFSFRARAVPLLPLLPPVTVASGLPHADCDDGRLDSGRRLLVSKVSLQSHRNECASCQWRNGGDLHHASRPVQLEDAGHCVVDAAVRGAAARHDGELICWRCFNGGGFIDGGWNGSRGFGGYEQVLHNIIKCTFFLYGIRWSFNH